MENLSVVLFISLVGMGLVFGAIVLFWGVLSLIGRLAAHGEPSALKETSDRETVDRETRRRAAVAAVAVALAVEDEDRPRPFPLPPTVVVDTWQSVMRAKSLAQRGSVR